MRWRFVDSITRFEAWTAAEGRKTVSLEEYSLLEPLGRKGCLPESLLVETCVQLGRWLVVKSSDFERTCMLSEIDRFAFVRETAPGWTLSLAVRVTGTDADSLNLACSVTEGTLPVGAGNVRVSLAPLGIWAATEDVRAIWRELYGATSRA